MFTLFCACATGAVVVKSPLVGALIAAQLFVNNPESVEHTLGNVNRIVVAAKNACVGTYDPRMYYQQPMAQPVPMYIQPPRINNRHRVIHPHALPNAYAYPTMLTYDQLVAQRAAMHVPTPTEMNVQAGVANIYTQHCTLT